MVMMTIENNMTVILLIMILVCVWNDNDCGINVLLLWNIEQITQWW